MTKKDRVSLAHSLFVESVIKPDPELRSISHEQPCFYELMEWKDKGLEFLEKARENL